MNKDMTHTLFRAAILDRPVSAVVEIRGEEYLPEGQYRLRNGFVTRVNVEKGYVTIRTEKGFRNTRLNDVLAVTVR